MKAFGPKGYGYGNAVGGDYVDRSSPLKSPPSARVSQPWSPPIVDTPLYLSSPTKGIEAEDPETDRPDSPMSTSTNTASTGRSSPFRSNSALGPGNSCCGRCGEIVYFAEQVLAAGQRWHKRCLSEFNSLQAYCIAHLPL